MSDTIFQVDRAYGKFTSGEVILFPEGFSPRKDLDGSTGKIINPGHISKGQSVLDKILVIPASKGGGVGICGAAGSDFADMFHLGFPPRALVFGKLHPAAGSLIVQTAVAFKLTITEGWSQDIMKTLKTGDIITIDPDSKRIELIPLQATG